MSQAYSDPSRENEPTSLPDVEVWSAHYAGRCANEECDASYFPVPDVGRMECPECGTFVPRANVSTMRQWWWWTCLPGCLPDSEPMGPFDTEAEALADAREGRE